MAEMKLLITYIEAMSVPRNKILIVHFTTLPLFYISKRCRYGGRVNILIYVAIPIIWRDRVIKLALGYEKSPWINRILSTRKKLFQ